MQGSGPDRGGSPFAVLRSLGVSSQCSVSGCDRVVTHVLVRSDTAPRSGMCGGCHALFGSVLIRELLRFNRVRSEFVPVTSPKLRLLARAQAAVAS